MRGNCSLFYSLAPSYWGSSRPEWSPWSRIVLSSRWEVVLHVVPRVLPTKQHILVAETPPFRQGCIAILRRNGNGCRRLHKSLAASEMIYEIILYSYVLSSIKCIKSWSGEEQLNEKSLKWQRSLQFTDIQKGDITFNPKSEHG